MHCTTLSLTTTFVSAPKFNNDKTIVNNVKLCNPCFLRYQRSDALRSQPTAQSPQWAGFVRLGPTQSAVKFALFGTFGRSW